MMPGQPITPTPRLRFDRNELAGSFGDIGTDLPLLLGLLAAAQLDGASVFILFGLLQVLTGLAYGLPMPMQPLKAMAVLVITNHLAASTLYGAGLAIGCVMLLLTVTGTLGALARLIPACVVRGIQFGLGLSLASLALKTYVPAAGREGWALAAAAFVIMLVLWQNRRFPAALFVVGLGAFYAAWRTMDVEAVRAGFGLALPVFRVPAAADVWAGFLVLALPQLALSLSNSVIATERTCRDLFPERGVTVRKIGWTYSLVNLVLPFFSGVPACHGCGGLAGHYAFGARTGGSVILYGAFFLLIGLFFSGSLSQIVQVFPQPVLGIILLFEAVTLLLFLRDQAGDGRGLTIALLVALIAFLVPQGYAIGLVVGTLAYYLPHIFPLTLRARSP
jgi:xanthine/uracil/vitamin C permease (AzgA family)